MDAYRFSLYLGFTGMVSMAALSFLGQLGHSHGGHHDGHGGHAHGHGHDTGGGGHHAHHGDVHGAHAQHTGTSHHTSHSHHGNHSHHGDSHHSHEQQGGLQSAARSVNFADYFLLLLSPRLWFTVLMGFGATGIIIKSFLSDEPWRAIVAATGGVCLEKFLFAPLWDFWSRFAGEGHTLESVVAEEARAVTNFDSSGCGLIAVNLDGQTIQLLGRLSARSVGEGSRVRTGDTLLIESVDTQRQSCTVSPLKQF